ncbi:MAG TPA: zinc ribbon domain-containing protein [Thermoanaerobaculia bacterium]|nr:zinc ribbon domain-containing protein [Thermoanaerobaculia bacterium]
MPMFEYVCRACGERFEEIRSREQEQPPPVCPACASEQVTKLFSSFASPSPGSPSGSRGSGSSSCGGSGRFT